MPVLSFLTAAVKQYAILLWLNSFVVELELWKVWWHNNKICQQHLFVRKLCVGKVLYREQESSGLWANRRQK